MRRFWLVMAFGTVVRLVIAPFAGGFGYDVATFQSWAGTLREYPVGQFYEHADAADHLPGDLWIMKVLQAGFGAFGGDNLTGDVFTWLLKVVPTISDVTVAVLLLIILRRLVSASVGVTAATWFFLNPAAIFNTAIWGQWDSLSMAVLLGGVALVLRGGWVWVLSSPFFVWTVLIKPQLAIPSLAFLALIPLVYWDRGNRSLAEWARLAAAGVASVGLGLLTALLVLTPFSVDLLLERGGTSTLMERLTEALDLYVYTTLGAANFWMIPIGSLERVNDVSTTFLGISANQWGSLLLVTSFLVIAVIMLRTYSGASRVEGAAWASTAVVFAVFMLPTRVHERYLFPILVFAVLLVALRGFRRSESVVYWAISLVFAFNLLLVYGGFRATLPGFIRPLFEQVGFVGASLANVALFAIVLMWPILTKPTRSATPITSTIA